MTEYRENLDKIEVVEITCVCGECVRADHYSDFDYCPECGEEINII